MKMWLPQFNGWKVKRQMKKVNILLFQRLFQQQKQHFTEKKQWMFGQKQGKD